MLDSPAVSGLTDAREALRTGDAEVTDRVLMKVSAIAGLKVELDTGERVADLFLLRDVPQALPGHLCIGSPTNEYDPGLLGPLLAEPERMNAPTLMPVWRPVRGDRRQPAFHVRGRTGGRPGYHRESPVANGPDGDVRGRRPRLAAPPLSRGAQDGHRRLRRALDDPAGPAPDHVGRTTSQVLAADSLTAAGVAPGTGTGYAAKSGEETKSLKQLYREAKAEGGITNRSLTVRSARNMRAVVMHNEAWARKHTCRGASACLDHELVG
ncbi:hypothetical protein GCM10010272_64540 [Streptomyces lateritius]|nr:hypothetical protein GCM10010272_64540 [Streptomyces lateritius]